MDYSFVDLLINNGTPRQVPPFNHQGRGRVKHRFGPSIHTEVTELADNVRRVGTVH